MPRTGNGIESLTYEAVADLLGVRLCGRECWMDELDRHTVGYVTVQGIHWRPRVTKVRGLRNFLKLVARYQLGTEGMAPLWKLWAEASEAYALGLTLGVRFPRELGADDRARARALLAQGPRLDKETYERIERWARD